MIVVSIVSHGQNSLVNLLLADIVDFSQITRIIITCNIEDDIEIINHSKLLVIHNNSAKGFGANHNNAFAVAQMEGSDCHLFCVLNPDIRMPNNPFPELMKCLLSPAIALAAPAILAPSGNLEISARPFPRLSSLMLKAFGFPHSQFQHENPDWVAGMFMLFNAHDFTLVGGFDEGYFLYYEDVDICYRLRSFGRKISYNSDVSVVHDARRDSHKKVKYGLWHAQSMARFLSYFYLDWKVPNLNRKSCYTENSVLRPPRRRRMR